MRACWFALTFLLLTGCVEVAVSPTPYYLHGPQQPDPPQGDIPGGTSLWVLWKQDGYTQVITHEGEPAWVWSKSLVPLEEWEKIKQNTEANPDGSLILTPTPHSTPGEWQLYYGDSEPGASREQTQSSQ